VSDLEYGLLAAALAVVLALVMRGKTEAPPEEGHPTGRAKRPNTSSIGAEASRRTRSESAFDCGEPRLPTARNFPGFADRGTMILREHKQPAVAVRKSP
jgi:hypothetical protein